MEKLPGRYGGGSAPSAAVREMKKNESRRVGLQKPVTESESWKAEPDSAAASAGNPDGNNSRAHRTSKNG
jgi:hypothetical protein